MFGRKSAPVSPHLDEEIEEARASRDAVRAQWPSLTEAITFLQDRRQHNGFGDDLQVTWTPKRKTA